jgi:hypothetical protein
MIYTESTPPLASTYAPEAVTITGNPIPGSKKGQPVLINTVSDIALKCGSPVTTL